MEVVLDEAREVVLEEVEVDIPEATMAKATMARRTRMRMRVMMALQGRTTLDGKSPAMQIDTLSQTQQVIFATYLVLLAQSLLMMHVVTVDVCHSSSRNRTSDRGRGVGTRDRSTDLGVQRDAK